MTSINTSEFNTTVYQLQGIFKQLGSSAMGEYGTYVNSVFAIGGSIEQIANGNESQKSAAIQSLINQAMNLVNKLVNIQASANNKVREDREKARKVEEEAVATEQELNSNMQQIGSEIDGQTQIVENASLEIQESQEALAAKEEKINKIIKQIQTEQEALKNATTIEEKRAILGTIETLGLDISSLMADISSYQETLENATSVVEAAFTNIETAKGNAVQKQQDGQLKVIENTQEAAEATSSTVATQAEGVKNITLGTALEASATAEIFIPIVGGVVSSQSAQKGAELIAAGTTETTGSLTNLQSLLQGIGKVSNNTQLLSTFKTAIGGALNTFNSSIGSWNAAVQPMITSIGSLTSGAIDEQVAVLQGAVEADNQTLDSYQKGESKPAGPQVTITNTDGESVFADNTGDPYRLITPNVKLSFGI